MADMDKPPIGPPYKGFCIYDNDPPVWFDSYVDALVWCNEKRGRGLVCEVIYQGTNKTKVQALRDADAAADAVRKAAYLKRRSAANG